MSDNIFLTAKWVNLINITYKTKPETLEYYLPEGLELDIFEGSAFISLVAFDFLDTKVKGLKIPFHINFPEINLRFYVKNKKKRGVVFIKEFIPKFLISFVANTIYNEPYSTAEMRSEVTIEDKISVKHILKNDDSEYYIELTAENKPFIPAKNSKEHFFKEHSWGFGTNHSNQTSVYRVEHPVWEVYPVISYEYNFNFEKLYGKSFKFLNEEKPFNILFSKGSEVKVYNAKELKRFDD